MGWSSVHSRNHSSRTAPSRHGPTVHSHPFLTIRQYRAFRILWHSLGKGKNATFTQKCRFLSQEVREMRAFQFRSPRVFATALRATRNYRTQKFTHLSSVRFDLVPVTSSNN